MATETQVMVSYVNGRGDSISAAVLYDDVTLAVQSTVTRSTRLGTTSRMSLKESADIREQITLPADDLGTVDLRRKSWTARRDADGAAIFPFSMQFAPQ